MISKVMHLNAMGVSVISFEPRDVLTVAEDDGINLQESLPTCSRENQRPTEDCSLKPQDLISKISIETKTSKYLVGVTFRLVPKYSVICRWMDS